MAATTSDTPANIKRADGKVWLEGILPGQRDTSPYAQGLPIVLQYLGHKDADYTHVMGYSGVALALQMDLRGPIRDGKDWDTSQLLTGSKAFGRWLELLDDQAKGEGLGRDSWDNNLVIHLRYNRAAAVAYLRDVASRHPPAIAGRLNAAADLYQQVLDEAAKVPFWGQFQNNPEVRPAKLREYTEMVRRISVLEGQAIAEIRQALPPEPATAVTVPAPSK